MKHNLVLTTLLLLVSSMVFSACMSDGSSDCSSVTFTVANFVDAGYQTGDFEFIASLADGTELGRVTVPFLDKMTQVVTIPFSNPVPPSTVITVLSKTYSTTISMACGTVFVVDPMGDSDGDGIPNGIDNCPNIINPSQEDGWGTNAGDACDTSLYDNSDGVKAFQQKDGSFNLFGNCRPDGDRTKCLLIANIQPAVLVQTEGPQRFQSNEAAGWYVEVYFMGVENGNAVYQVNTYDANSTLQDDGLEIVVGANGAVSWR